MRSHWACSAKVEWMFVSGRTVRAGRDGLASDTQPLPLGPRAAPILAHEWLMPRRAQAGVCAINHPVAAVGRVDRSRGFARYAGFPNVTHTGA
ncbi:hypothetical protein LC55x_1540 [Lysobacter capsici]|nr:hypothetical protein LC55x_1540 [Lysobacter capsici]